MTNETQMKDKTAGDQIFNDLVGLAGLVMLGAGLWMKAPWVALAVCGALVLAGAIMASVRGR
jgi:hypothetical protein